MAPQAWVGYLIGYTASNIWKIWDPKANTVTDERDVKFDEEITFDPDHPFHTLSIQIEMPQEPVVVQQLPEINIKEIQHSKAEYDDDLIPNEGSGPSGGEARDEVAVDVEVGSQGVNVMDASESGEQIDQSEKTAENNKRHLPTPEPTPSPNPAQSTEPIHTPARIPRAWDDSPYTAIPIRTNQRPQTPSENNDKEPLDLTDASPIRQYDDSPGRQLLTGMLNQMSLEPEEQPEPAAYEPPPQPSREIRGDFSTDNILHHKQERKPKKNIYTLRAEETGSQQEEKEEKVKNIHYLFSAFSQAVFERPPQPGRKHRSQLPPPPKSYRDIKNHPLKDLFYAAADLEYNTLVAQNTWKKVRFPSGKQVLPLIWVFTYKFDDDGYLLKAKGQIYVRGDLQIMNREDTTATTLAARTFRTLMALTAAFNLDIRQLDATNAFVNSLLNKEVYTQMAAGYSEQGYVWQLNRALYGLRRSPRLWQKELTRTLESLGFHPVNKDTCLYTDDKMIIMVFVDDILFLYQRELKSHADQVITGLRAKYDFHNLGDASTFLSIKIQRDRANQTLWINQAGSIDKMVDRYHLQTSNPPSTPATGESLTKFEGQASHEVIHEYQQKVGSCTYPAVITRPDIAKATSNLSEHLINPSPKHMESVNRVIQYLQGTRNLSIRYTIERRGGEVYTVASDAAYGDHPDRKSSEGYLCLLYGGAIDWKAGKQKTVTTSTTEAKLLAISAAAKNIY